MSFQFTRALLEEFRNELTEKKTALDTDPHFWMPLTLDWDTYAEIMAKKKVNMDWLKIHYNRMQQFHKNFISKKDSGIYSLLFGPVNVGSASYWWDYGQVITYYNNNIKLTNKVNHESVIMRKFYNIPENCGDSRIDDGHSVILGCNIKRGKVVNSVLIGVSADEVNVTNSIVVNSSASAIVGSKILLYNVVDSVVVLPETTNVRADVVLPKNENKKHVKLHTDMHRSVGDDWALNLHFNSHTFADIYQLNRDEDLFHQLDYAEKLHLQQRAKL